MQQGKAYLNYFCPTILYARSEVINLFWSEWAGRIHLCVEQNKVKNEIDPLQFPEWLQSQEFCITSNYS